MRRRLPDSVRGRIYKAMLNELFDPVDKEWQVKIAHMAVLNCQLVGSMDPVFVYKADTYLGVQNMHVQRIKPRLHESLHGDMEKLLLWHRVANAGRHPITNFLIGVLNRLPFERIEEIVPSALMHHIVPYKGDIIQPEMTDEEMTKFRYMHHLGLDHLHTRLLENLLFT